MWFSTSILDIGMKYRNDTSIHTLIVISCHVIGSDAGRSVAPAGGQQIYAGTVKVEIPVQESATDEVLAASTDLDHDTKENIIPVYAVEEGMWKAKILETQAKIEEAQLKSLERQASIEEVQLRCLERQARLNEAKLKVHERKAKLDEVHLRNLERQAKIDEFQLKILERQAKIEEAKSKILDKQTILSARL